MAEPYMRRSWKVLTDSKVVLFSTCARPGRSAGAKGEVGDEMVHKWLSGLGEGRIALISLLGWKNGVSEYDFYSFRGTQDSHRRGAPTWTEWLALTLPEREFVLREHPTHDFQAVPDEVCASVKSDLVALSQSGHAIFLIDSGGQQRAVNTARRIGAKEHFGR